MKCPNCQAALTETAPACPVCGFSYSSLGESLGRMPIIKGMLTDTERVLTGRQARRIRRRLRQMGKEFSQMRFHVVLMPVDAGISMAKFAFWIFNGASICSSLHKGGLNFHNLLLIDVDHQRANLSIGYGLEPFISEAGLAEILSAGEDMVLRRAYGEAVLAILDQAATTWHGQSAQIPRVFGLRRKGRPEEEREF